VALRRTCRCTEFHRVKNANLRHPSAMCQNTDWCSTPFKNSLFNARVWVWVWVWVCVCVCVCVCLCVCIVCVFVHTQ